MSVVSVKQASKILGTSEQFVRIGLQRGILPIGNAVKMSSHWTYYISPKLLEEYTGVKVGDTNEKENKRNDYNNYVNNISNTNI